VFERFLRKLSFPDLPLDEAFGLKLIAPENILFCIGNLRLQNNEFRTWNPPG